MVTKKPSDNWNHKTESIAPLHTKKETTIIKLRAHRTTESENIFYILFIYALLQHSGLILKHNTHAW